MTPLEKIEARIAKYVDFGNCNVLSPILTIDEFFDGNDAIGSIGPNLIPTPEPSVFYTELKNIRKKEEVAGVYVEIYSYDKGYEDWPFADKVWIITTAEPKEVLTWYKNEIKPDEAWLGKKEELSHENIEIPPGYNLVVTWWD